MMKGPLLSAVLAGAAALAIATATFTVEAATNLNSSRSNTPIANAADEAACIKAGGTVEMKSGKKVCVVAVPATNLNSSKSN